jgi:hypothetical protein
MLVSAAATSGQTIEGKLTPDDPLAAAFGESVAVSGNTAIVGAPFTLGPGGSDSAGAAYVFEREQATANAWRRTAKLTAPDPTTVPFFGFSVSISGGTVVIGAAGAAYVFVRDQGGPNAWGQVANLTTDHPDFGTSVSISGDTLIVGGGQLLSDTSRGTAHVFERNRGGINAWGEVAMLTASDQQPDVVFDGFGQSVSISDSIAIVGAPSLDAAYVFRRDLGDPNAWGEVAKLTASDFSSPIRFGESVQSAEARPSSVHPAWAVHVRAPHTFSPARPKTTGCRLRSCRLVGSPHTPSRILALALLSTAAVQSLERSTTTIPERRSSSAVRSSPTSGTRPSR